MVFLYQARIMLASYFRHPRRWTTMLISVSIFCVGFFVLYRPSGLTEATHFAVDQTGFLTLTGTNASSQTVADSMTALRSSQGSVNVSSIQYKSSKNYSPLSLHGQYNVPLYSATSTNNSGTKPMTTKITQPVNLNASSLLQVTTTRSGFQSEVLFSKDGLKFVNSSQKTLPATSETRYVLRLTNSAGNQVVSINKVLKPENNATTARVAHNVLKLTNSSRNIILATPVTPVRRSTKPASEDVRPDCPGFQFAINDSDVQVFRPAVSVEEGCMMLETVHVLTRALHAANIPYFLYGGTLIGSWRHHGMVPWDDDVDLSVDVTRLEDVRHALIALVPLGYGFKQRASVSWKFYPEKATRFLPFYKWPFVDIFFYEQNATHVWDRERKMFPDYVFPIDWILPTKPRPFNGMTLQAPRETKKVLDLNYNISQCAIGRHSHQREMSKDKREVKTVPCDALRSVYAFVQHVQVGKTACNETLVMNGVGVSWVLVDSSPQCS
ncbi:hypothetical protein V1264_023814 [Littorina saxatilis]|uniref:LicD/FKTN/FKRP nucleotidyltransferase domain-containing protein n=2 Tax=Littorina saxatilis TaxID=31220 RepID=A0AAN9GAY7_9CAEN